MTQKELNAKYSNLAAILGDLEFKLVRLQAERSKVIGALEKLQAVADQIAAAAPPNNAAQPKAEDSGKTEKATNSAT